MKRYWNRTTILSVLVTGSLILGTTPAVYAQDQDDLQTFSLGDTVVTATRTPQKELTANADITVITKADIEKHHYINVSDALRHVPGVNIESQSATGENYSSNGIYINGSSNVVFLIDGMRMNTNGSSSTKAPVDEFINMDSIEKIEVLKGSASTLYGADAEGGVINVITRKMLKDGVKTDISTSMGSYGKKQYNVANYGRANGYYWSLDAQKRRMGDYKDAKGHNVVNDINSETLNFKLGKKISDKADIVFDYQKYKSEYQRPDIGTMDPTVDYGTKDNEKISLQYKQKITDRLENTFSLFRNNSVLRDAYNGSYPWYMDLTTEGYNDQLTYKTDNHTLIGGIDYYSDKINHYDDTSDVFNNISISNRAYFLQDQWNMTSKWNLTSGIRYNKNSIYGDHAIPSFVLGYNSDKNTNYYVSYKRFFVAPKLFQLYSTWYGNRDLNPEEGRTWELGVNHIFNDNLSGVFHVFSRHADNMIRYDDSYRYYNTGEQDSDGFNLSLNKKFNKNLSADLGYTYLHIEALDGKNPNNNGLLPESVWTLGLNYTDNNKLDAYINTRGVINREGKKGINADHGAYVTYWVWNLGANYKATENITVYAKLNNIFNQYYDEGGTAGTPTGSYWYAMPGRNFELGVKYSF